MPRSSCLFLLALCSLSPGLPPVLNKLGLLYNQFGQHRRAERVFRRALAIQRQDEVLGWAEQVPEARAVLNEAMDIAGRTLSNQPAVMAKFSERQADLLRRAGDKEGAKAAARRARQWWDQAAGAIPGRHTVEFEDLQWERARR